MTLPVGLIAMSDINAELGRAWNTPLSLNDPQARNLAYKPSGPISMDDFRGKQRLVTYNANNPFNQDLYSASANFGGAGAFGGALLTVTRGTTTGGPDGDSILTWFYYVNFSVAPNPAIPGSLVVRNNSTGAEVTLPKISATAWQLTVANGGGKYDPGPYYWLVRGQANDNFTITRVV